MSQQPQQPQPPLKPDDETVAAAAAAAREKLVRDVLDEVGEEPRMVRVQGGRLLINDVAVNRDEPTERLVLAALREKFLFPRETSTWVEVGPMLIDMRRRKLPVVAVLLECDGATKLLVRLAFGRSMRFFVPKPRHEMVQLARACERKRLELLNAAEA